MTDVTAEHLREALRPPGPVRFRLREHQAERGSVLIVEGELDLLTAPKLGARLDGFVRRGAGDVVLDLSEALFIDSVGLSVLLNVQRRLSRRGRSLSVLCDEGPVRRVIEMARLQETLRLAPAT